MFFKNFKSIIQKVKLSLLIIIKTPNMILVELIKSIDALRF